MLKFISVLIFILYCFVWFRIPLGEDSGLPFQRVLGWLGALFLLGNFLLLKRFPIGPVSRTLYLMFGSFLFYLFLIFFIQRLYLNEFSFMFFLMDFLKYLAIFGCLFITYFSLKNHLISEKNFEKLIIISGILSIFFSYLFYGLFLIGLRSENEIFVRSFGGALGVWPTSVPWLPRLAGTTSEPQQFSIIFLTPLLLMCQNKLIKKYFLVILFGLAALLLSQSKFSIFSLFFVFLYLFIIRKRQRVLFLFIGILILPIIGLLLIKLPVFSQTINLGTENQAFSERYENLILLIDIIREHFFIGIGPGHYGIYRGATLYGDPNYEPSYKPNLDYLKIFSETGFFGFALVTLMLIYLIKTFYKAYKSIPKVDSERYLAIYLGTIAILLNMFIGYEFLHVFLWINCGYLAFKAENQLFGQSKNKRQNIANAFSTT